MKRRELLLGSGGVTLALLAGRVPTAQAHTEQDETAETALELLPAESTLEVEYTRITLTDLTGAVESDDLTYEARFVDRIDGIDASNAEAAMTAWTEEDLSLGSVTGSFDRVEPGETSDEPGEWWVGTIEEEFAIASTDGQLIFARSREADDSEDPLDVAEKSCEVARNGGDSALDTLDLLSEAFDRFGDKGAFYFLTDLESDEASTVPEKIRTLSAGFERSPTNVRGHDEAVENEYLFKLAADADLDGDEGVKEILEELEQGTVVEFEASYDGDVVFVEATVEAPPERNRERAPDADIRMDGKPDSGTATIEHTDGEPVPAEKLELWLNGELAATQPADEFDEFAPGDALTVDTGPLANVYLRWFDEEENEFDRYVDDVVGRDSFEVTHDPGAGTVELTYTAEADADTDRLELVHEKRIEHDGRRETRTEQLSEQIDALDGTLSAGDSLVVSDVEMRDTVRLRLDVPPKPAGVYSSDAEIVRHTVRPPRLHIDRRPEEAPIIRYYGEASREADSFRVLIDDSEADTQPADEHDTLERDDEVQLEDVEFGSEIVIEWTAGDEPVVVEEHVVEPYLHLEMSYDDEAGTVTIEHRDGETVDAGALELRVDGEPTEAKLDDDLDDFGPEDTVTVDAEPFARVEVRWRDGTTDVRLDSDIVGENLFEASYDLDTKTVELVYTGEQAADATGLELERFGREGQNGDSDNPFDSIETLTSGDSVTVKGVSPDETIQIIRTGGKRRHIPLFHFNVDPEYAFRFENQDGTLVVKYNGAVTLDANEFRILVDDTEAETQPGDVHDELEQGATTELGSYPPGTEIVIEWPASGDPSEVEKHLVVPDADFAVSYDADEGTINVEHAGGDDFAADELGIYAPPITDRPADWDGDGTVTEGDSTTLEAQQQPEVVLVIFRDSEVLHEQELAG